MSNNPLIAMCNEIVKQLFRGARMRSKKRATITMVRQVQVSVLPYFQLMFLK